MKALVVYESLWGNTAAIGRAIAEGLGPEAKCLSTAEAAGACVTDAELVVAGAPILGFIVSGRYGPLKDGELERARAWGAELAEAVGRT